MVDTGYYVFLTDGKHGLREGKRHAQGQPVPLRAEVLSKLCPDLSGGENGGPRAGKAAWLGEEGTGGVGHSGTIIFPLGPGLSGLELIMD